MLSFSRILVYILPAIWSVYCSDDILFIAVNSINVIVIKTGITTPWKNYSNEIISAVDKLHLDKTKRLLYPMDFLYRQSYVMQLEGGYTFNSVRETHGKELALMLKESEGDYCVDDGIFIIRNRKNTLISMYNINTKSRSNLNIRIRHSDFGNHCKINEENKSKYVYLDSEIPVTRDIKRYAIFRCPLNDGECIRVVNFKQPIYYFDIIRNFIIFQTLDELFMVSRDNSKTVPHIILNKAALMTFAVTGKDFYHMDPKNYTLQLKSKLKGLNPIYIPCVECRNLLVLPETNTIGLKTETPLNNYLSTEVTMIQANNFTHEIENVTIKSSRIDRNRTEDKSEEKFMASTIIACSVVGSTVVIPAISCIIIIYLKKQRSKRTETDDYSSTNNTRTNSIYLGLNSTDIQHEYDTTNTNNDTEQINCTYLHVT